MTPLPPISTLTDPLFPDTTLFRSGCNNDDVRASDIGIIVRTLQGRIETLHRAALGEVKCFTLRHALHHVEQDHIAQFLGRSEMRQCSTDIASADERNLFTDRKSVV